MRSILQRGGKLTAGLAFCFSSPSARTSTSTRASVTVGQINDFLTVWKSAIEVAGDGDNASIVSSTYSSSVVASQDAVSCAPFCLPRVAVSRCAIDDEPRRIRSASI
ncbi:unnamed protein product [Linum trigynum]|uniref:Secreted protein n=1 Tax=Linum trigynum TaxID=586398 RepID=A0AAV2F9J5_9ROSI